MSGSRVLAGKVALVAGATRGAGRAFAIELAAAGAVVYATGRSSYRSRSEIDRPETIEETAVRAAEAGGEVIAVVCDHLVPEQVQKLVSHIRAERGRLDILVNNIWGGDHLTFFYDLAKVTPHRMALALSKELAEFQATAVSLTPGWIRSEAMLDQFGVTEDNWRDGTARDPHFCISETPHYVALAAVALAADADRARFSGQSLASWDLAPHYGVTDLDGTQPHMLRYHREVIEAGKPADDARYR